MEQCEWVGSIVRVCVKRRKGSRQELAVTGVYKEQVSFVPKCTD